MIYTVTLNPAVDRELTVSSIEYDTVLRSISWQTDCGGKGFNVSRMLRSMGMASCALGFVGGKSGEILHEGLQALGIETDFVWVEGETRTNISIVTTDHDRYLKVNEPGPEISSARQNEFMEKMRNLIRAGDWWVLAGSLPPCVSETMYGEMIEIIEAGGAHAILDTSGVALVHGCQAGAYLVKPNAEEAEKLTGVSIQSPQDAVKAAQRIHELGSGVVIISLGKSGALLSTDQKSWLASAPEIEESNPIGAGDSMVGGVVWALSCGFSVNEALKWGVACGAASASMDGTAVSSLTLVKELYDQIEIVELV
ncbi:MAG: 1-phosphofructokinase [Anaerolineaceae bacterium]|nr:1-phosphofructokinase [Anaerolineaceae bacterium]